MLASAFEQCRLGLVVWCCSSARQEQHFAKAVVFVERTCQVTHRKLLHMRGTKQCPSFCHVCHYLDQSLQSHIVYCLRDEVAIDATSLIDRLCYPIKVLLMARRLWPHRHKLWIYPAIGKR